MNTVISVKMFRDRKLTDRERVQINEQLLMLLQIEKVNQEKQEQDLVEEQYQKSILDIHNIFEEAKAKHNKMAALGGAWVGNARARLVEAEAKRDNDMLEAQKLREHRKAQAVFNLDKRSVWYGEEKRADKFCYTCTGYAYNPLRLYSWSSLKNNVSHDLTDDQLDYTGSSVRVKADVKREYIRQYIDDATWKARAEAGRFDKEDMKVFLAKDTKTNQYKLKIHGFIEKRFQYEKIHSVEEWEAYSDGQWVCTMQIALRDPSALRNRGKEHEDAVSRAIKRARDLRKDWNGMENRSVKYIRSFDDMGREFMDEYATRNPLTKVDDYEPKSKWIIE